jgi:hypothetical protein
MGRPVDRGALVRPGGGARAAVMQRSYGRWGVQGSFNRSVACPPFYPTACCIKTLHTRSPAVMTSPHDDEGDWPLTRSVGRGSADRPNILRLAVKYRIHPLHLEDVLNLEVRCHIQ